MTYSEVLSADGSYKIVDSSSNTKVYADTGSSATVECVATLARTDTSAKNLFTIPANAVPIYISIYSGTASNAGTTAVLSVGKTGTNTFFISSQDVKGVSGQIPCAAAANLGAAVSTSAVTQVVGIYAETGTASNTGGPFTVILGYQVP